MKKIICLFISCLLIQHIAFSQSKNSGSTDYKGVVYDSELTGDIKWHTNGWAIGFNKARIRTYYKTTFYNIEFGEVTHPKEYSQRLENRFLNNSPSSFVYGKQNNFFALRAGIGEKRYFTEKAAQRGVAVGMSYVIGGVLGILKPYYLELRQFKDNNGRFDIGSEKYSAANASRFLDIDQTIYGGSSFWTGIGELNVVPGIHGKIALHLDWGAFDEYVKACEVGIMADIFSKKIPIMITTENRPFFINFYLNLQLGKRS